LETITRAVSVVGLLKKLLVEIDSVSYILAVLGSEQTPFIQILSVIASN